MKRRASNSVEESEKVGSGKSSLNKTETLEKIDNKSQKTQHAKRNKKKRGTSPPKQIEVQTIQRMGTICVEADLCIEIRDVLLLDQAGGTSYELRSILHEHSSLVKYLSTAGLLLTVNGQTHDRLPFSKDSVAYSESIIMKKVMYLAEQSFLKIGALATLNTVSKMVRKFQSLEGKMRNYITNSTHINRINRDRLLSYLDASSEQKGGVETVGGGGNEVASFFTNEMALSVGIVHLSKSANAVSGKSSGLDTLSCCDLNGCDDGRKCGEYLKLKRLVCETVYNNTSSSYQKMSRFSSALSSIGEEGRPKLGGIFTGIGFIETVLFRLKDLLYVSKAYASSYCGAYEFLITCFKNLNTIGKCMFNERTQGGELADHTRQSLNEFMKVYYRAKSGRPETTFDEKRGDYILLPSVEACQTSFDNISEELMSSSFFFNVLSNDFTKMQAFYRHQQDGSPFGTLVSVEGQRADNVNTKLPLRRSCYLKYYGYSCIQNEISAFLPLSRWLKLGQDVEMDTSSLNRLYPVPQNGNSFTTPTPALLRSKLYNPLNSERRRIVSMSLVRECVRQILSACSLLEMVPDKKDLEVLQCIDMKDVLVDSFGRVAFLVGNNGIKELEKEKPVWNFGQHSANSSNGREIERLMKIAAVVLVNGLFENDQYSLNDKSTVVVSEIPKWTRFNEVTPVDAIDFIRCSFHYEKKACALLCHPFFTVQETRRPDVIRDQDLFFNSPEMYNLTVNNPSICNSGKRLISNRRNLSSDPFKAQGEKSMKSSLDVLDIRRGKAAENFAILTRAFSSSLLNTDLGTYSSVSLISKFDVITPGVWPSCMKLEKENPGVMSCRCYSNVHANRSHDDYFKATRTQRMHSRPMYFSCECRSSHFESRTKPLCHTCMGACHISFIFTFQHDLAHKKEKERKKQAKYEELRTNESFQSILTLLNSTCEESEDISRFMRMTPSVDKREESIRVRDMLVHRISSLYHINLEQSFSMYKKITDYAINAADCLGDVILVCGITRLKNVLYAIKMNIEDRNNSRDEIPSRVGRNDSGSRQRREQHRAGEDGEADEADEADDDDDDDDDSDYTPSTQGPSFSQISNAGETGNSSLVNIFHLLQTGNGEVYNPVHFMDDNLNQPTSQNRKVPPCFKSDKTGLRVRGGEEFNHDHLDMAFAMISIFLSNPVGNIINHGIFEHRPIVLSNSLQKGIGNGVTNSMWQDFWYSVFKKHNVFKLVSPDSHYYTLCDLKHVSDWTREGGVGYFDNTLSESKNVCKQCTKHCESIRKTGRTLSCQLASPRFFRQLGNILLYCVVNEIYVPYHLHPSLLFFLFHPTLNSMHENKEGSVNLSNLTVDSSRLVDEEMANSILSIRREQISSLCADFKWKKYVDNAMDFQLGDSTISAYVRSNALPMNVLSREQRILWCHCCLSFSSLPVMTLLRSVCGRESSTSIAAFASILHGSDDPSEPLTAEELFASVSIRMHVSSSVDNFIDDIKSPTDSAMTRSTLKAVKYLCANDSFMNTDDETGKEWVKEIATEMKSYTETSYANSLKVLDTGGSSLGIVHDIPFTESISSSLFPYAIVSPFTTSCSDSEKTSLGQYALQLTMQICRESNRELDYTTEIEGVDLHKYTDSCVSDLQDMWDRHFKEGSSDCKSNEIVRCLDFLREFYLEHGSLWLLLYSSVETASVEDSQDISTKLHRYVDALLLFSSSLLNMLQYNTYMYLRKWVLEDSTESERNSLLYMATASRVFPESARRSAENRTLAGCTTKEAIFQVAKQLESMYGNEITGSKGNNGSPISVHDVANWRASFGTLSLIVAIPTVSEYHAKAELLEKIKKGGKIDTSDLQAAEPKDRTAVTAHLCFSTSASLNYTIETDESLKSSQINGKLLDAIYSLIKSRSTEPHSGFCKTALGRIQNLSVMRTLKETTFNRLPEFSSCDSHVRLYLYESYDKFRDCVELSIHDKNKAFTLM